MDKVFNVEIDGQITLPDGSKLGPLYETTVKVVQPSGGGYDELSDGNITEVDGKKYLTPLGGGVIRNPLTVEFTATATEDGEITYVEEPISEGELIVGETYQVTVNGVTDDYVCYVDEYDQKIIGTFEDDMTVGDWQFVSFGDGNVYCNVFGNVNDEFSFIIEGVAETTHIINDKFLPKPDNAYIKAPFSLVNTAEGYKLWDKNYNEVTNAQFIEYETENFGSVSIYFQGGIFEHSSGVSNDVVGAYTSVTSGVTQKRIVITHIEINPYDADPNSPVIPVVTKYENSNISFSRA